MAGGRCYNRAAVHATNALDHRLDAFPLDPFLRGHVEAVMAALPAAVRHDLLSDPGFSLCDYEPGPNGVTFPVAAPGRTPSRCVLLKRTLRRRPPSFIRWVIAHELAHAHLRNAGRHPAEDPEHAADALAAEWGFPRPTP